MNWNNDPEKTRWDKDRVPEMRLKPWIAIVIVEAILFWMIINS